MNSREDLAPWGELAAGIAHDFRNILTPIIGYAAIHKDSPELPPLVRKDLATIHREGTRAAHLVKGILDFGRKSVAQKRTIHLAMILKETVEMLERTIPSNIKIVLEIESGDYLLEADPTQLQQVVINLAINARDAMPEGGEFRIRLFHRTFAPQEALPFADMAPGKWIVLEFADTGVGMRGEVLHHIFEPFFTTKERSKSTGLGLSQVYGIVRQHEGYIDVASSVGRGTTFTVYLPPLKQAIKEPPLEATTVTQDTLLSGKGETVLVVDDNESVLEMIRKVLEGLTYRTLAASDGKEGLKIFEQHKKDISVVLVDMVMPQLGGTDLIRALKDIDPDVKIIVMSGYLLQDESMPEGIVGFLCKPFDMKTLAGTVAKAVSRPH